MRKLSIATASLALTACITGEPRGGAPVALAERQRPADRKRPCLADRGRRDLQEFERDSWTSPRTSRSARRWRGPPRIPPDFASAGPHWNPAGHKHGMNNPAGPHAGDLPNVEVAANGVLGATVTLPGAVLVGGGSTALIDADGAALVVHAGADDYMTDPSGNSGARIACAVLQPVAEIR